MSERFAELLAHFSEVAKEDTLAGRNAAPYLYLADCGGEHDKNILAVLTGTRDGADIASMARQIVFINEPRYAFLQQEMWTVNPDLPPDDPTRIAVDTGRIRQLSTLPPDKRGEVLSLYAEAVDGEYATRLWIIRRFPPDKGGGLRLEDIPEAAEMSTRFRPLFIEDAFLRMLETGIFEDGTVVPKPAFDLLRMLSSGMSEQERRTHIKRVLANVLSQPGAGGTTRGWNAAQQEAIQRGKEIHGER